MKAGDVFVRIAQAELRQNVVPHVARGAGGKRGDGLIREIARAGGSTAGIRDGTRGPTRRCSGPRRWRKRRPARAAASRSCRRAPGARAKDRAAGMRLRAPARMTCRLLGIAERAVEHRGWNAHLRQLRRLVLHQRDQRRNHDHGPFGDHRGQLVAERFAAAGGHDHAGVTPGEQASHDALLQRDGSVVAPVAAQRRQQIGFRSHDAEYRVGED